jgi:hypothetical protein
VLHCFAVSSPVPERLEKYSFFVWLPIIGVAFYILLSPYLPSKLQDDERIVCAIYLLLIPIADLVQGRSINKFWTLGTASLITAYFVYLPKSPIQVKTLLLFAAVSGLSLFKQTQATWDVNRLPTWLWNIVCALVAMAILGVALFFFRELAGTILIAATIAAAIGLTPAFIYGWEIRYGSSMVIGRAMNIVMWAGLALFVCILCIPMISVAYEFVVKPVLHFLHVA